MIKRSPWPRRPEYRCPQCDYVAFSQHALAGHLSGHARSVPVVPQFQMWTVNKAILDQVLIGGNHLASSLISRGCFPASQMNYDQVLHEHGILCADMWFAWKAIMNLRECVETVAKVK